MNSVVVVFSFLLGSIAGSFLNVAALRHKVSSMMTRSRCVSCGHKLSWYELIPVISFLVQKGRCRNCNISISPRYVFVEALSGFLFVILVLHSQNVLLSVLLAILLQLSIVLFLYDFKHLILPAEYLNILSVVGIITGIVYNVVTENSTFLQALGFSLVGALILSLPLFLLWVLSGGKWIGFGDVRLAVAMGGALGLFKGFSALIFSFWIGAVVMLLVLLVQKIWKGRLDMNSMIPFGPFLLVGMWLVIFLPIDLQTVYSLIRTLLW